VRTLEKGQSILASDNEKQPKKGVASKNVKSSRSMTIEQIQDLITNVVKAQLGDGSRRTYLYTKPYTKRFDALRMSHGYQPLNSNSLIGKLTQKGMPHTLLRHATTLGLMVTL